MPHQPEVAGLTPCSATWGDQQVSITLRLRLTDTMDLIIISLCLGSVQPMATIRVPFREIMHQVRALNSTHRTSATVSLWAPMSFMGRRPLAKCLASPLISTRVRYGCQSTAALTNPMAY